MQKSLITILLDQSGSMASRMKETLDSLNEYIGSLREAPGDNRISLVGFKSGGFGANMVLTKILVAQDVKEVRQLLPVDMSCGGGTPLLAAIQQTITAVAESLNGRSDIKPVVVIQTDGEENASGHQANVVTGRMGVSHADVRSLIEQKETEGWQFVFMGCGINAYQDGMKIGLASANVVSYGDNPEMTRSVFRATALNTSEYLTGSAATMGYTSSQKLASGDVFEEGK